MIVSLVVVFAGGVFVGTLIEKDPTRTCPVCNGEGVTGMFAASGAAQRCGICRGSGRLPRKG
jgi:DnaJ-class molecular chaperone